MAHHILIFSRVVYVLGGSSGVSPNASILVKAGHRARSLPVADGVFQSAISMSHVSLMIGRGAEGAMNEVSATNAVMTKPYVVYGMRKEFRSAGLDVGQTRYET